MVAKEQLRIEIQLKNDVLHRAVLNNFKTMGDFCRKHHFSITQVSAFIRLKKSPFLDNGQLRKPAMRMAVVLEMDPGELFPKWLYEIRPRLLTIGIPKHELDRLGNHESCLDIVKKIGQLKSGYMIEE